MDCLEICVEFQTLTKYKSTVNPVYSALAELVGLYMEVAYEP